MLVLGGGSLAAAGSGLSVSPELINEDLPVMLLTSLACLPIFWTKGTISRLEGGLLLGLYILYVTDNVLPRTTLSSWSDEFRLVLLCLVLPVVMILIITQSVLYWRSRKESRGLLQRVLSSLGNGRLSRGIAFNGSPQPLTIAAQTGCVVMNAGVQSQTLTSVCPLGA